MRRAAAFFDLDRTLIPGASTQTFHRHLRDAGLTTRDGVPGLFFRAFELVGESAAMVQLGRLGPRAARGWSVAALTRAARSAAEDLEREIPAYGRALVDEHRRAGRALVLATASPRPLVEPFAERLGFDHVIATGWGVSGTVFDGRLDGPMVWGRAKAEAVRGLAADEGLDLDASFAYSDSFFDSPMLSAVGHPVAVNPDPRLAARATLRRWEIRHFDKPAGVVKIAGRELQDLARPFVRPEFVPNARIEMAGVEHIPREGAAIIVANHRSNFDPTVISLLLARAGRPARYLGRKEVFDIPVLGDLAVAAGVIRVDRDADPIDAAVSALRAGDLVVVMPQGHIPRGEAFHDPELKGRWGAARMAAATRAPVIPVGLWGTEAVWPPRARVPSIQWNDPAFVRATVGAPVELKYRSPEADTRRIMAAITGALPEAAHTR